MDTEARLLKLYWRMKDARYRLYARGVCWADTVDIFTRWSAWSFRQQ